MFSIAEIPAAVRLRLNSFWRDTGGNLTMIAGLSAIPIVAAAGMAIDYARISRVHDEMQLIADGATLAASGAKSLTGTSANKKAQRVAIATNYVNHGLAGLSDVDVIGTPVVTATSSKVSITMTAKVKGSFLNVLNGLKSDAEIESGGAGDVDGSNGKAFGITVKSEASWNAGVNYVCLLALHPSDPESLTIRGMASVDSKNCSIQVNSSSNQALSQSGSSKMVAKKIAVKGNYVGSNYTPMPVTDADIFNDPLAAKFATDYAATFEDAPVLYSSNAQMSFPAGDQTIQPGIYRGGIRVGNSVTLTLSPGTYFIENGEFEIRSGGVVKGDGVTVVLTGNSKSRVLIQAQASLALKAPGEGKPFASLAIAQHPNSVPVASKENTIIGGGSLEMTGILYFPRQTLKITGGGDISQTAPLFAIAAYKIFIEGNAPLNIGQAADSDEAGLPALPSTGTGESKVTLR